MLTVLLKRPSHANSQAASTPTQHVCRWLPLNWDRLICWTVELLFRGVSAGWRDLLTKTSRNSKGKNLPLGQNNHHDVEGDYSPLFRPCLAYCAQFWASQLEDFAKLE